MKREKKKNTSRVGAVAELSTLLDGASKDRWEFHNASSEGPVDLIFFKLPNLLLRVQVKRGDRVKEGEKALAYADVLAIVDSLNRVRYYTLNARICRHLYPCQTLRRTKKTKSKKQTRR